MKEQKRRPSVLDKKAELMKVPSIRPWKEKKHFAQEKVRPQVELPWLRLDITAGANLDRGTLLVFQIQDIQGFPHVVYALGCRSSVFLVQALHQQQGEGLRHDQLAIGLIGVPPVHIEEEMCV